MTVRPAVVVASLLIASSALARKPIPPSPGSIRVLVLETGEPIADADIPARLLLRAVRTGFDRTSRCYDPGPYVRANVPTTGAFVVHFGRSPTVYRVAPKSLRGVARCVTKALRGVALPEGVNVFVPFVLVDRARGERGKWDLDADVAPVF